MSLTKVVNGQRVTLSQAEEDAILAEWSEPRPLDEIRAEKTEAIRNHALSLMRARIPALDSFAMVGFLETIWPALSDPASQPDLAYVRDVYVHAKTRLEQAQTADRETVEGYDPAEDTGWP